MDKYGDYDATNEQWKCIQPLLPPEYTGKEGRPRKNSRIMLNGMLWINHSGAQWRRFRNAMAWQSVYVRFAKWREEGIWEYIFAELSNDADTENPSIDSTCVKLHESSNGGEKAENKAVSLTKSGLNTNIHAVVDALGNLVAFCCLPATITILLTPSN